jgi:hypothetical protein
VAFETIHRREHAMFDPMYIVSTAVHAGRIQIPTSIDADDAISMFVDFLEDVSDEIGTPHEDEIEAICVAVGEKISGMAADADAVYRGQPMTVSDADEDVDGYDTYRVTVGDANALFTFDPQVASLQLL